MAQIELRLSSKLQKETGMCEVLIRFVQGYSFNTRAKTGPLFMWFFEEGFTKNRPFDGINIGTEKVGTPYYITIRGEKYHSRDRSCCSL